MFDEDIVGICLLIFKKMIEKKNKIGLFFLKYNIGSNNFYKLVRIFLYLIFSK